MLPGTISETQSGHLGRKMGRTMTPGAERSEAERLAWHPLLELLPVVLTPTSNQHPPPAFSRSGNPMSSHLGSASTNLEIFGQKARSDWFLRGWCLLSIRNVMLSHAEQLNSSFLFGWVIAQAQQGMRHATTAATWSFAVLPWRVSDVVWFGTWMMLVAAHAPFLGSALRCTAFQSSRARVGE